MATKTPALESFVKSFDKLNKTRPEYKGIQQRDGYDFLTEGHIILAIKTDTENKTEHAPDLSGILSSRKGIKAHMDINAAELAQAIKNALVFASASGYNPVTLTAENKNTRLSASSEALGCMTRELNAIVDTPFAVRMDGELFAIVIKFFADQKNVTVNYVGKHSPVFVTCADSARIAVIMPLELTDEQSAANARMIESFAAPQRERNAEARDNFPRQYTPGFDGLRNKCAGSTEWVTSTPTENAIETDLTAISWTESLPESNCLRLHFAPKSPAVVAPVQPAAETPTQAETLEPSPAADPRAEILARYAWIEKWENDPQKRMYKSTLHNGRVNMRNELAALEAIDVTAVWPVKSPAIVTVKG